MEAWEREVAFNRRRQRDNSFSPWTAARQWRRRFWYAMAAAGALAAALALALAARR
jgi:hypothetical protein